MDKDKKNIENLENLQLLVNRLPPPEKQSPGEADMKALKEIAEIAALIQGEGKNMGPETLEGGGAGVGIPTPTPTPFTGPDNDAAVREYVVQQLYLYSCDPNAILAANNKNERIHAFVQKLVG